MTAKNLILILGDQLSHNNPALLLADRRRDTIVLAEVAEETTYVAHNRHKIAFILSAMRHFHQQLCESGFDVIYYRLSANIASLQDAVALALEACDADQLLVCEPGEYRLSKSLQGWQKALGHPVRVLPDSRFLAGHEDFRNWAGQRKQLRMEYFYREMRKRYGLLLDESGKPQGGRWNFDKDNRRGWRGQTDIPQRRPITIDAITAEVIAEVERSFPDNPGRLADFYCAVTAEDAQKQFDWFCTHALADFGTWQDAMAEQSPWLFHSLIAMYLNVGLLEPLAVCQQVETSWREGHCELAAAEGFIRQVLGWREYVRGVYWHFMPAYKTRNYLAANRPLPDWFWSADTDLHCLHKSLSQSLDLGYAHHIQRLMVIGNFALLAGLDVGEVTDWYLAVYVDAFEWVELPNTLGMALYADGGLMASKPYAASGKYIQRQSDYCQHCRYDYKKMTGAGACPFNALYWRFIDKHQQRFADNPRMGMMLANWRKKAAPERKAIVAWADNTLDDVLASST